MNDMQLIFIFNANSMPLNQAMDFFHKIFSPETFPCHLSKLINNKLSVNSEWETFIAKLPFKVKFYHRDMFIKKYPNFRTGYPVVLLSEPKKMEVFISTREINSFLSLSELIMAINKKINHLSNTNISLFNSPARDKID